MDTSTGKDVSNQILRLTITKFILHEPLLESMDRIETNQKKTKKRSVISRLRKWCKTRAKRRYLLSHSEDKEIAGPYYDDNELVETFSIEEDLDSCCQGLLDQEEESTGFDETPLFVEGQETHSGGIGATQEEDQEDLWDQMIKRPHFARNTTQDSNQASLESLDSLEGSYGDGDDDDSLLTRKISNTARAVYGDLALGAHVHFLRAQTEPHRVHQVQLRSSQEH